MSITQTRNRDGHHLTPSVRKLLDLAEARGYDVAAPLTDGAHGPWQVRAPGTPPGSLSMDVYSGGRGLVSEVLYCLHGVYAPSHITQRTARALLDERPVNQ